MDRLSKNQIQGKEHSILFAVGVDIGGTALKIGIISLSGRIITEANLPLINKTVQGISDLTIKTVERLLHSVDLKLKHDVEGLGIVMPGMVDPKLGIVHFAANLPDWKGVNLADIFEKRIGVRPRLENDANVALLAEIWQGAATGMKNACIITLGTGVGGAAICNGHLIRGKNNLAAEIGHSILTPGGRASSATGVDGVFEEYVSARAIGAIARERIDEQKYQSKLSKVPRTNIDAKTVFSAAKEGDLLASEICQEAFNNLGILCVNICRFYDPEVIILTGGLTSSGEYLLNGVIDATDRHWWKISKRTCEIKLATLGVKTGILGAAFLNHPDSSTAA